MTDRHTDTQTDVQTYLIPGVNISSHEMTEYINTKRYHIRQSRSRLIYTSERNPLQGRQSEKNKTLLKEGPNECHCLFMKIIFQDSNALFNIKKFKWRNITIFSKF